MSYNVAKNAIIIGANSTIANSVINRLGELGFNFCLMARDEARLNEQRQDLLVKFPNIEIYINTFDALKDSGKILEEKLNQAFSDLKEVDLVLIAHGNLPVHELCEQDFNTARDALQVNGLSVIEICHYMANKLQQNSTIAVISSVAGERGRQSNYIYGTAKGMLNTYLQGLRNRLSPHGINVLTILPGFVDTKMTAELKKGLLWAAPKKVADDIVNGIFKHKDIIYTPWFWKYIMCLVKLIPESIFKKMKL
jgi:short-subunit dehydrogenase